MTNAKERITEYKRKLSAITERRKEHKEEIRLKKEVEREEKKFIREEKFRLKHPQLHKAKKLGIGFSKRLYELYKVGKQKSKKRKSKKLRM